jgi:hypothetical protein
VDKLEQLYEKALSRRNFVVGAGALGAATAIAGCSDNGAVITTTTATPTTTPTPTTTATPAPSYTDNDILNYALNLEYLEAQFYLYAATGAGLATADIGSGTSTTGTGAGAVTLPAGMTGSQLQLTNLSSLQRQILVEVAYDEQSHVRFLRSALGTNAVAMPAIDLSFFGPLAVAAGITTVATGSGSFTPFGNAGFDAFLIGAFIFEDVGVTAYSGAAPLISVTGDSNGILLAAAGILAVEAYHAAYVRTTLTGNAIAAAAAGTSYPYLTIANQVSALRAQLGGGNETMLVLPSSPSTPSAIVAATPANAIAYARTTDQVHHIVYGNGAVGAKSGGFFPNGTNSIFSVTTT